MSEVTVNLQQLSFFAAIFFTVVGAILGLMALWVKEFWESESAVKLLITDAIFAVTSIIIAAITKWLA